jgi:hypothetical protein
VFQKVPHVLFRSVLGILIGATIASLIWIGYLSAIGKSVGEAIRGEVEDAVGTLEGLLALGIVVGTLVGLVWGLGSLPRANSTETPPDWPW